LNRKKVIELLKDIQRYYCRMCEIMIGGKDIDVCFKCPYHKKFNDILKELNDI